MKTLLILTTILLLLITGCTNESKSREALIKSGYTNINITGWAFGMCSKDDTYCTEFSATNPQGMVVTGAVGCGIWLKGCTIRF